MIPTRTGAVIRQFSHFGRNSSVTGAGARPPASASVWRGEVEIPLYESVLKDPKIPQIEKNLLRYIIFRCNGDTRLCYFTQARAGQELGISSCRISRAVSWLRKHDYIKTKFNGKILVFEVCSTVKPALSHKQPCFAPRANRTRSELAIGTGAPPPSSPEEPISEKLWEVRERLLAKERKNVPEQLAAIRQKEKRGAA
jgi:hypothetical protein